MTATAPIMTETERALRAKRAVENFRRMIPMLNSYARAFTGNKRLTVEVSAQIKAATDGKKIYFCPPIELGDLNKHTKALCDRRDPVTLLQQCKACATTEGILVIIYHEIAHVCYGTFDVPSDQAAAELVDAAVREAPGRYADRVRKMIETAPYYAKDNFMGMASLINPYLKIILNALEDARVNTSLFEARRGTKVMFDAQSKLIFERGIEVIDQKTGEVEYKKWNERDLNDQAVIAIFCATVGYDITDWFVPEVVAAMQDPQLQALMAESRGTSTVAENYGISFRMLARLRELGYCRNPEDPDDAQPEFSPPAEEDDTDPEEQANQDDQADDSNDETEPEDEGRDEPCDNADTDTDQIGESDEGTADSDTEQDEADSNTDEGEGTGDGESSEESDEAGDSSGTEADSSGDDGESDDAGEESGSSVAGDSDGSAGDDPGTDDSGMADGSDASESDESGADECDSDADADESSESAAGTDDGADVGDSSGPSASDFHNADEDSDSGESSLPGDDGDPFESGEQSDSVGTQEAVVDDDAELETEALEDGDDDTEIDQGEWKEEDAVDLTDLDPSQSSGLEWGTPEEAERSLEEFGGHAEKPPTREDELNQQALEVAIMQGMYFETPSTEIYGVREHVFGKPFLNSKGQDVSTAWTGRHYASHYTPTEMGMTGDYKPTEATVGKALLKLRTVFEANARSHHQTHLKSGRVNGRVLGKRAPLGDERLFKKKIIPGKKDYFVVIGLDISGSTVGRNLGLIKAAAWAQAELLTRLGVPFAVYAFTAAFDNPDTLSHSAGGMYVDMYHIKTEHEAWNKTTQQRLQQIGPDGGNLDGHNLEFFRKVCDKSTATDKIIMYYSDGRMPASNYAEELEVLQRELVTCKQKGYTVCGVGIRTDSPAKHGLPTVRVDRKEDVMNVVLFLEKMLRTK